MTLRDYVERNTGEKDWVGAKNTSEKFVIRPRKNWGMC